MAAFRALLVVIFGTIFVYTSIVIAEHGMGLFPTFFGDMTKMAWPGQFNLDFMCLLLLSGLWTAWRNEFSPAGLGLAVLAFLGGAPFLTAYLLYLSFKTNGDIQEMLLGKTRAHS
jgi:hypothetical protein